MGDKPRVCQHCQKPLRGRQVYYCSTACRVNHWHERRAGEKTAEELLSGLPQDELRAVIRRVCQRRWPGKKGRISVRFGKPGMPPGGPGPRH